MQRARFCSPATGPVGERLATFAAVAATGALSALALVAAPAAAADVAASTQTAAALEEIIVTASLRHETLAEIPVSITVLPAKDLDAAGLQHFEDVLALAPNLNWSGGTSRPRYFQMRGVGELEQYQGAPNPSVGFLIDDIDLSGVGAPATTFDIEQVEVLRGPQGTRYGANAMAGLIQLRSREATPTPDVRTELTAADHGTWSAGVAAGGAFGAGGSAWRLAGQRFVSDGFQRNVFLQRADTNGRDETTVRGKLHLLGAPGWQVDLAGLYADLDNGFDAFTPDNSNRMLSDRPGRDSQLTSGASMKIRGDLSGHPFQSTTACASSASVYSFDGDWGNDAYWGEYAPYDYFSRYDRDRSTLSQDLRLQGTSSALDWVAGVYAMRLAEDSVQRDYFAQDLLREPLHTEYEATHVAAYGEVEWPLADAISITVGMRVETRSASYDDSDGGSFDPRNTMVGGHVSLEGRLAKAGNGYATLSRGYKAGGFNIGQFVPDERRQFAPEYLWNAETGLRGTTAGARLQGQLAFFYMWREEQQVATSFQLVPGDPLSYVFYTDNAAQGRNYGIEASGAWLALPALNLGATLGLLHTAYLGYRYGERNLDGRAQSHAPEYQYSLFAQWAGAKGWMARADVSGSDAFYFDASHDQRARPYALLNLKAGFTRGPWSVHAWARNVTNEQYAVRGFYFGLEPPDYADTLYVQHGDERLMGVTLQWRW